MENLLMLWPLLLVTLQLLKTLCEAGLYRPATLLALHRRLTTSRLPSTRSPQRNHPSSANADGPVVSPSDDLNTVAAGDSVAAEDLVDDEDIE